MAFLFARAKKQVPQLVGLQVQTAVNVLPIPIIYGTPRIPGNCIYQNGFRSSKVKSGGGKGLLTSGKDQSQVEYHATFILAIGEGIVNDVVEIFDDQSIYTFGDAGHAGRSIEAFSGTDTQTPWGPIVANWPNDAFSYKDTAYFAFPDCKIDSSGTIPFFNFAVRRIDNTALSPLNRYTDSSGAIWLLDADPAASVYDFLTNSRYGVGFPSAYIDSSTVFTSAVGLTSAGDAALSTYCQAVGLAWSLVLNNAEPASSILDRWMKNLVVAPVWTGAILKFIPYLETYTSANPGYDAGLGTVGMKYYRPNVPVLFDFTDDHFIQSSGEDPVVVSRIDVVDVKNVVRINFRDRGIEWNDNVSEVKDEISVELYGPRVDRLGTADEFTHGNYAATSIGQRLQRNLSVRNTYTWKLDWRWCILDPMDIVTLTDSVLGLNKYPVRITSLEEDEKGIITVVAEDFPLNATTTTVYAQEQNDPPIRSFNKDAPAVNTPFIFEPTPDLLSFRGEAVPTIIIGASGGPSGTFDSNWGGCNVWVSNDNVTYVQQGSAFIGPSRQGVTTASLAAFAGSNPDNTNTLSVDLTESDGQLETVTSTQAAQNLSLCGLIDSNGDLELLCYTTATLTATNKYDLTGLYRGLFGTRACSHASGARFLRIDSVVFESALASGFIGTTLYVKLQSFNIYGLGIQDLSTCTAYTYVPTGAGTDYRTADPVIAALLAGTGVDLELAIDNPGIDLNLGGSGGCDPVLLTVDLGPN